MPQEDERKRILDLLKETLAGDKRVLFAYGYGSLARDQEFRDIDVAVYLTDTAHDPYTVAADLKAQLSSQARRQGLNYVADDFDVRLINDAPFTVLARIFQEGVLLVDRDPESRTDVIEQVSFRHRECAGLLAEASLV